MIEQFFERRDPYSIVVDVTPDLASAWLSNCNTHNRKLVDAHVERLANEIIDASNGVGAAAAIPEKTATKPSPKVAGGSPEPPKACENTPT